MIITFLFNETWKDQQHHLQTVYMIKFACRMYAAGSRSVDRIRNFNLV